MRTSGSRFSSSSVTVRSAKRWRAAVEATAGLGRLDPASRSIEELQAEALLERADLEAHRRLRDAELLGSLREAAPLDDRAERRELSRIHKQSLCTRLSRNHLAS